ncbi:hypothetical protein [Methyloceanibacter sp.]|uniref:hypothetical protein n=1 Tax=Methyloceanibacter sp. TaxID=1965321 RepID=UPI002D1FA8A4|nr:hypothetical protein [Methyloceanibacter sp.]
MRLEKAEPEAVTRGAPVPSPPNTGGVTGFRFRDPDGHMVVLLDEASTAMPA